MDFGRASLRGRGGALLASLVLHILGLAGVVAAMRGPDAPSARPRASLVTIAIRQDAPSHAPHPREAEVQPTASTRQKAPVGKEHHPVVAAPQSASLPALLPATLQQDASLPASPVPVISPPAVPPRDSSADAALEAYRVLVWGRIQAARPHDARGSGRVVLRFVLDRRGRLISAQVAQSSGMPQLDRLALRAVHAAAPFAPPPVEVEERGLSFLIPMDFHN